MKEVNNGELVIKVLEEQKPNRTARYRLGGEGGVTQRLASYCHPRAGGTKVVSSRVNQECKEGGAAGWVPQEADSEIETRMGGRGLTGECSWKGGA